jgi:hypothetical protein
MIGEWFKETWSDSAFNRVIQKFPKIRITGHFPSKGEVRLAGPKEDVMEFIKILTS